MISKEDALKVSHKYGTIVPKSLQAFVDYAFIEGSQYGRRIVPNGHDAFEYCGTDKKETIFLNQNRSMIIGENNSTKYGEPEFYYDKAFCNYWKRGVEKLLQTKGVNPTEKQIRDEMFFSMNSLSHINDLFCKDGAKGVNLKNELENGKFNSVTVGMISNEEYAKMFIDTFANGEQYRLNCFAFGLKYFLYAREDVINDNTVGTLFGDMYTDKDGNIVVDSPAVANMKYKNSMEMLRDLSHAYGQNQNQDNGMEM